VKKALITGITGQDGSYLAELLLKKKYKVYGIIRRSSSFNTKRIDHIFNKLHLVYGDLSDSSMISKIVHKIKPDEIYNLGAQSHVKVSFDMPEYTCDVGGLGALRILEAIKGTKARFYQASSSEMFGDVVEVPQNENTRFNPVSPYACAKVFGYWITKTYRKSYDMFACNGILFNHESPRRGGTFVTQKIIKGAVNIKKGRQRHLRLGNLDAKRDWGHAKEYIEAMWLMLQQDKPDDYVISTGKSYTVREFLYKTFSKLGIELVSNKEKGICERLYNKDTGRLVVVIDSKYYRPCEVNTLLGDFSKAYKVLKWKPRITINELIQDMLTEEL
jgi:GDPmannose 4,6-dehydratase